MWQVEGTALRPFSTGPRLITETCASRPFAQVLCELLELWYKNGDKVLIFSMSLKVLDLLSELMETTHYNYLVLDGKTPAETRE